MESAAETDVEGARTSQLVDQGHGHGMREFIASPWKAVLVVRELISRSAPRNRCSTRSRYGARNRCGTRNRYGARNTECSARNKYSGDDWILGTACTEIDAAREMGAAHGVYAVSGTGSERYTLR